VGEGIWLVEACLDGIAVSIYVLRGEHLAVIDTGYSYHPTGILSRALKELGYSLGDVCHVLNTHGHPDHSGGNAAIKRLSGAHAYLHANEMELASGADAHYQSAYDMLRAMRLMGWEGETRERKEYIRARVEGSQVDHILQGGEKIDLGRGMNLHVIHTPGHSPGSVTFYLERQNIAFTGDAIQGWGSQSGILPLYFDPKSYLQSLDRIEALQAAKICLGHSFVWSRSNARAASVREGSEVSQLLRDSKSFVSELAGAVEAGPSSSVSLAQRVTSIAGALTGPFHVPRDCRGHFPASSAATIISHIEEAHDWG